MSKELHSRRYWFAVGYHQCLSDQHDPPSKEMCDYIAEINKVDILKEYYDGRRIAEKDLKNGIY
jgi:hypothetical protein